MLNFPWQRPFNLCSQAPPQRSANMTTGLIWHNLNNSDRGRYVFNFAMGLSYKHHKQKLTL